MLEMSSRAASEAAPRPDPACVASLPCRNPLALSLCRAPRPGSLQQLCPWPAGGGLGSETPGALRSPERAWPGLRLTGGVAEAWRGQADLRVPTGRCWILSPRRREAEAGGCRRRGAGRCAPDSAIEVGEAPVSHARGPGGQRSLKRSFYFKNKTKEYFPLFYLT